MGIEGHIDRLFDDRLRTVRSDVSRMAERVDAMIQLASDAACDADPGLAWRSAGEHAAIQQSERELDRACMVMLATRAPVASDLGFVMTAMKVAGELGRVADLANAICERAAEPNTAMGPSDRTDLAEIAVLVRAMLRDAVAAFSAEDAACATQVVERDREVNARFLGIFERTIERMARDSEDVRSGVHVQALAKRFERMADHASRAAEAVLAMLDGALASESRAVMPYERR